MSDWLGYLLAVLAVALFAPLLGWLAQRHGRRIKGGVAMASLMLGMGAIFDPPQKAATEAEEAMVKGDRGSGDPPDPEIVQDVARAKSSDG
ncbi:MAG: hypothetical protein ACXWKN_09640 [Phenylobacterium sp.]